MRASLAILFTLSSLAASAQGFYNESNIFIEGVNLYIDGEVSNGGLIENRGYLSVSGDWNNAGEYNGNGSVELNGNTPQVIAHGGRIVEALIVNGWGTKYLKGEMIVARELRLTRGIVQVSGEDRLKLMVNAFASGGSAQSFVDGALTVEGNGYRFFPVGKNGTYAPIEFLDASGGSQYAVELFKDAPVMSVENVIVRKSLYWKRSDLIGNFGSSRIAVDYEPDFFGSPENIILLVGNSFKEPFATVSALEHSSETAKVSTRLPVTSSIIMLGEISDRWTDADFYLSTALSTHARNAENKAIKIFGERLTATEFHFQVFDRWGALVFECHSLNDMQEQGWDGRALRGHQLATGTYPYRLSAYDKLGEKFERKGIITIVN